MNHAKEYTDNRKNKASEKSPTAKATRATPELCKVTGKNKRSAGNPHRSELERSKSHVTDAFLKCRFLPKLLESKCITNCAENKKMERDFYKSLSYLHKQYNIEQVDYMHLGFPYNIAVTLDEISKNYRDKADFENLHLYMHDNNYCLINQEKVHQNGVLYYIPVMPLFKWLRIKKRKKGAILLLSVFSYLYQIAKIPYYRDDDSFLYEEYEMLQDWLMDDQDEDQKQRQIDFKRAEMIGDIIGQKIYNLKNIDFFKQRVQKFKCLNSWDKKVLDIAKQTLMIYENYPNQNIFENTELTNLFEDVEQDLHYTMYMENYVSFYADHSDWLGETLIQSINDQFQEYSAIEEPTVTTIFDKARKVYGNLDFEIRLFKLLDRLAYLLINT
ncbi:hypothetical protein [Chryseobacterium gallinarum]|uniref:hypothetical protein n=1 Tax=Chryseobacterium gallinarum TaxID=1324352 RepID=UPI0006A6B212|nr:hypothetical protein [Chryseobacterium gallinarum]